MPETRPWTVQLTASAEGDYVSILRWTSEQFGAPQTMVYAETLDGALDTLAETGPETADARRRDDIRENLMALHVARRGRKGRHFILFRAFHEDDDRIVQVVRILHDAMDLPRHI